MSDRSRSPFERQRRSQPGAGEPADTGVDIPVEEEQAADDAAALASAAAEGQPGGVALQARALHRGGLALVANGAATGLLGVLYWVVAAHLFGAVLVGRNSLLISAMLTISGLAQLNYTRSLSSLIPGAGRGASRLVARVYLLVGGLSAVLGAAFVAVAPSLSRNLTYLEPAAVLVPGFACTIVLWSVFTLEDTVLASVRRATIVPLENAAFGVAKLVLLVALVDLKGDFTIFISWVAPLVFIVVPINLYAFRWALPAMPQAAAASRTLSPRWVRFDFAGYLLWLLGTSPLPILVLSELGPKAAASFYIPLTISTAVDLVSLNVGNALTAEVTRDHGRMSVHATRFLRRFWLLVLLGAAIMAVAAPYVLQLFGHHYRSTGGIVLRMLILAAPARSAMFLSNAVARAQGRGPRITVVQAVAAVGTLTLGLVLMPHLGVTGMATAWLSSSLAAGVVAMRWVLPLMRPRRGPVAAPAA